MFPQIPENPKLKYTSAFELWSNLFTRKRSFGRLAILGQGNFVVLASLDFFNAVDDPVLAACGYNRNLQAISQSVGCGQANP